MYVIFYLLTVFTLSYATTTLGYTRDGFLLVQLAGVVCFALAIPLSAVLAERGRRRLLIVVAAGMAVFGLALAPLLVAGTTGALLTLVIGLTLMGLFYGPIGTVLSELFPTRVRYSGSSLTYNLAGILGGSLAPTIATWLAGRYGLPAVGYYLTVAALLSLLGLTLIRETRDERL
jgi:MFS family permease